MTKINQEEYEMLKESLSDGYKWIARDKHNLLCTHRHKPVKNDHWTQQYWGNIGNRYKGNDDNFLQFIQWEDEEPHNIAELIEEYKTDELDKQLKELVYGESEETKVKKDKKWFIDKWTKELNKTDFYDPMHDFINEFISDVKQLDEPETLSEEWIDDHKLNRMQVDDNDRVVSVTDLRKAIVPNQDRVDQAYKDGYEKGKEHATEKHRKPKPVIPQFVANWIESNKDVVTIKNVEDAIKEIGYDRILRLVNWYENDNQDTFARAWLDGYTVVKEPKYYVRDERQIFLLAKIEDEVLSVAKIIEEYGHQEVKINYQLTEQEIKDYDPKYWAFRKPVGEVEE